MFSRFFVRRPVFAWVIAILIMLAGILAIRTLPVAHTFVILSFFYTNLLEYYTPRMMGDTLLLPGGVIGS